MSTIDIDIEEMEATIEEMEAAIEELKTDMEGIEGPPQSQYEKVYARLFGQEALELNRAAQKEYRARLDLKKPTTILESIKVGWVMVREEIKDSMKERRSNY